MRDNFTVLAVNDVPDQLELLKAVLKQAGYRVLAAAGVNEGFEVARRESPDLIISAAELPGGGGLELRRMIRDDHNLRSVPLLLLGALQTDTTGVAEESATAAAAADDDEYLEVPYEPMRLVAQASRLIERKRTRDALHETENRFRNLIENLTDIISIVAPDGTIIYESPSLENVLGYEPEELVGKNVFDFIGPEDAQRVIAYLNQALEATGAAQPIEYRFRHKDGSWRVLESVGKKFDDPARGLIAIITSRDVTGQKNALEAQRESENRFRTVFDKAAIGIALVDREGRAIESNPALQKMLGYSGEELGRMPFAEFTHPEDVAEDLRLVQEVFEGKRDYYQLEKRYIRKNGEVMWGNLTVSVIRKRDGGGEISFVTGMVKDITDRKTAEVALRASEERFQLISRATNDALWDWDLSTNSVWRNESYPLMFGYSPGEIGPRFESWQEKVHPIDRQRVINNIQKVIESGVNYWLNEYHFRRADGSYAYILDRAYVVYGEDGRAKRMMGAMMDISERRRAQEQLDHFFKVSVDLICIAGFDGYFKRVNPAWEKLLGYREEELLSKPFIEFVLPEDREQTVKELRLNYQGEKTISFENRFLCKDGSYRWLLWNTTPMPDEEMIYAVAHDITNRKEAEKALTEANERAIREYDRLLHKLETLAQTVGTARDLGAIFNAILAFARPSVPCSALSVSLYNQERSARQPIYLWADGREVDVADLEPVPVVDSPAGRAIKTGEVVVFNDYPEAHKNGGEGVSFGPEDDSRREVRSSLIAPMKIKGNTIGVIEVQSYEPAAYAQEHVTAMTMAANLAANAIENVRLLEQEQRNSEQLRQSQKLESVGRLAGGIAHDFNNMLTAINGYSGMILRQLGPDDPLRPKVEEIKKAGERSALLTHQLLAFSRQQVLKPKVLDITEVVIDTSKLLQRLIGEDIHLNIVPGPKIGSVKVDPGQLTQVIMNLAVNARDAMPQGGNLTIETASVYLDKQYAARHLPTKSGSYVMLAMTDTGEGMDDETLQHIFEPFYTTKGVGKGTGLGLATVYGIVKQSGGYIWAYSELGKGTTFKIYLPQVDEEVLEREKEDPFADVPGGAETILLVEDEEAVRKLARQILEACGYKIIEAQNGVEALAICREADCKIDLLITDVVMPKMGGRELAEKLTEVNPRISQLFISGYTDDAILRQGLITEGMNFIQKPFTFERLAQKVRELLDAK